MGATERCLVLGGQGFIGSHLVDGLLAHGQEVRAFDRPRVQGAAAMGPPAGVELVTGDFASEADVAAALEGCTTCFHLVSTTLPRGSNLDPAFDVETNLVATLRFLRLAAAAGVRTILFASSGGTVYGRPRMVPIPESHPTDPTCSYGITKLAIEKYLALFSEQQGVACRSLRLANPYGERQRVDASQGAVAVFLGKALRNEPIDVWGDGSVVRDYLHIEDVVAAFLAVMAYEGPERVFNIGSGRGTSLAELVEAIGRVSGRSLEVRYLAGRPFDVPINVLDTRLAARELAWRPRIAFEQGLARTWDWLRSQE